MPEETDACRSEAAQAAHATHRPAAAVMLVGGLLVVAGCESPSGSAAVVDIELVAGGFTAPLGLVSPPDDPRRFVIDQVGTITILDAAGSRFAEPFLDLEARMIALNEGFDERGLLGLAFHPRYAENGRFFVFYSAPLREGAPADWNHTSTVSEFRAAPGDPDRADVRSERVLLEVAQPHMNHNAGDIAFGPDGYLYVALGDGGGANDVGPRHPPLGNGQDITTLPGSVLRIDVDTADDGSAYRIPDDNPFAGGAVALPAEVPWFGDAARPEIYAWGLRNPFRMSFDRATGQLWLGDVGQDLWEEVNLIDGPGNFGWNLKEGAHGFDPDSPSEIPRSTPDRGPRGEPLVDPIIVYGNSGLVPADHDPPGRGISVIGGYVYRGRAIPELQGHYIFGDWSTSFTAPYGKLFVAAQAGGIDERWRFVVDRRLDHYVLAFGEDADGEVYILTTDNTGPSGTTGNVYRVVPAP